jgi:pyrroloquinoline quinone (PQQ) biosynthesis protein C
MMTQEWANKFVELARADIQATAYDQYYGMPLTKERAKIYLGQLALFIRHRRDCWSFVSGNCPVMSVKRKILEHEYEEVIEDEYSKYGHLDLVVRQANHIGMSAEEVLDATPLPMTLAALYSWGWMTRIKTWQEGLAALMITERVHDNRQLEDLGGGHSLRTGQKWMKDLGFTVKQIPNTAAHSKADEKHSEMFLSVLADFVPADHESKVLQAAKESLEIRQLMYKGISDAMEQVY